MISGYEGGVYSAVMAINNPRSYSHPGYVTFLHELVHHIQITSDGKVFETHYDCTIPGCTPVVRFDPPREWDPTLLRGYRLTRELKPC